LPVVLHGAGVLGGKSLAISRKAANVLELYTLGAPTGQNAAATFQRATTTLPSDVKLPDWLGVSVYRGGHLHVARPLATRVRRSPSARAARS
jgi:hypothetical protein